MDGSRKRLDVAFSFQEIISFRLDGQQDKTNIALVNGFNQMSRDYVNWNFFDSNVGNDVLFISIGNIDNVSNVFKTAVDFLEKDGYEIYSYLNN